MALYVPKGMFSGMQILLSELLAMMKEMKVFLCNVCVSTMVK